MKFRYFRPRDDIRDYVSSYYSVSFDTGVEDVMRAEIANVRFLVKGRLTSDIGGDPQGYAARSALLCGPTHQATNVGFSAGCHVFGAAVTPLGWARLFEVDASELADRVVALEEHLSGDQCTLAKRVMTAPDDETRVAACDHLFASMADQDRPINQHFLDEVTAWITAPESNELSDLLERFDLSKRQVERLSKKYFGCPPKLLHRKFRALTSANRLVWNELTDWREAASTHYYDQPHFIREFKHFNGRTPTEFIKGAHLLVRATLQERLQIAHRSPFSLIG
ncbi:AraC family transcriptional regulator [Qipengyuania sp. 1NDH17]|uniref:AraC family transcriptional regulator n=1 Tax=Qipengyuania polymorpha TaxID=2867234 RepID=A0ABS7IU78_9SPHN|nr:AraC family transcriptional regulator [Qipengyuania polymorpha]MBX7456860.1 AraC family transcriptional regulator [Qipengyuania polymorpha]